MTASHYDKVKMRLGAILQRFCNAESPGNEMPYEPTGVLDYMVKQLSASGGCLGSGRR